MNIDYCFTKRVLCAVIFAMFLVTACTSVTPLPADKETKPPGSGLNTDSAEAAIELAATDTEVMRYVFSAELLGAENDYAGAAEAYLEAALISNDPEIAERAARVAVSANEWQMVALASDRWAMLDSSSLDARQLAAGSRLRQGDYVAAEYQLEQILELTESNQAHGWRLVTSLLAPANDQVRANKVLNNLLQKFDASTNVDALFARSQLAARTGELTKAIVLVNQAIGLEPARADLLAWSGRLAVTAKDEQKALLRYQQAWEINPQEPAIALAYAELLKRSNDIEAAQAVLAGLTDTPEMRFSRIIFAMDVQDREMAETLYQGFATANYSAASDSAFYAAQSAELLEHKRQAISWYKKVSGERSFGAIMRQAFLLADLGDVGEARNLLAQVRIDMDTGAQSQSYQAEAQILQDAGQREEALEVLNEALLSLPKDVPLRYARALMAVPLGQLELAEGDLRHIISIQPGNAAALNALGYTLADLTDRLEEAEQLILLAYELQPEEPSIVDSMGWIAYRLGRLQEAEQYLSEAWNRSRNAEIAAHLGEVLWVSGKQDMARKSWQAGIELESDNEILMETMQRFGELP